MYIDFTAGGNDYKLRLSTRSIVALEKVLGCNPIMVFGTDGETIPTMTTMVQILHASLQKFHHNITLEKAYEIFDDYLDDGHQMINFISVIMDIYKVSGIINADSTGEAEVEERKN